MNTKTFDFLLCFLGIHPFDFRKSDSDIYEGIVEVGKEIGLQNFAGLIAEYQYRAGIWSSFITLEYEKPHRNEI